jgi:hypothetical protein
LPFFKILSLNYFADPAEPQNPSHQYVPSRAAGIPINGLLGLVHPRFTQFPTSYNAGGLGSGKSLFLISRSKQWMGPIQKFCFNIVKTESFKIEVARIVKIGKC